MNVRDASASPSLTRFERLRERATRLSSYAFWVTAGFILTLAVERLVLHPHLAATFGDVPFGAFVWVLGVVNLVGMVAANGFVINLVRDLKSKQDDEARDFVRQALMLTAIISAGILTISGFIAYPFADEIVRKYGYQLFTTLSVFAAIRGVQSVLFSILRIERHFRTIFALRCIEGAIMLSILYFAQLEKMWVIGAVYIASVLLPSILAAIREPMIELRGKWSDRKQIAGQLQGWMGGAALALTEQGQLQASRLILGATVGSAEVTVLYAGTSMGNFFVAPVSIIGGLLLSIIAAHTTSRLTGKRGLLFLALVVLTGVSIWGASHFLGTWLVKWRYPSVAPQTLQFYHLIAGANGLAAIMILLRPVAVRYLPMRWVNATSATTVIAQVGLLLWLTRTYGARGAAIALLLSSLVGATLWLATYLYLMSRPPRGAQANASADG